MKQLIMHFLTLSYLLFTINSSASNLSTNQDNIENDNKILKIGVLVPLSGEFKEIGKSILKAIQLSVYDLGKKNIKIYPKDSKNNADDSFLAAKEFENLGVEVVIGPIFYDNLKELNQIKNITFISLTNKTQNLSKNVIAFGINIESQIKAITEYIVKKKINKTIYYCLNLILLIKLSQ